MVAAELLHLPDEPAGVEEGCSAPSLAAELLHLPDEPAGVCSPARIATIEKPTRPGVPSRPRRWTRHDSQECRRLLGLEDRGRGGVGEAGGQRVDVLYPVSAGPRAVRFPELDAVDA